MTSQVTVTIAAYNHARFIRRALDGLVEQTFRDFKIIACDDGSTDGTYNILKEYEAKQLADKLVVYTHPGHINMGIQSTRVKCLQFVDTEFFIGHASDDYWEPSALEYLVGLLRCDNSRDFAYGHVNLVDENGDYLFKVSGNVDIGMGLLAAERLMLGNPVRAPSILYRRTCLDIVLSVPPYICFSDWYQNVLLFLQKQPYFYNTPVVNYRVHSTNTSIGRTREFMVEKRNEVFQAFLENHNIVQNPTLKAFILCRLAESRLSSRAVVKQRLNIKCTLQNIHSRHDRERVILSCWSNATSAYNRHNLLFGLPGYYVVRVFARIGPSMALRETRRLFPYASFAGRFRLIGLLLLSWIFGLLHHCFLRRSGR